MQPVVADGLWAALFFVAAILAWAVFACNSVEPNMCATPPAKRRRILEPAKKPPAGKTWNFVAEADNPIREIITVGSDAYLLLLTPAQTPTLMVGDTIVTPTTDGKTGRFTITGLYMSTFCFAIEVEEAKA